jgi:hypothetical protein
MWRLTTSCDDSDFENNIVNVFSTVLVGAQQCQLAFMNIIAQVITKSKGKDLVVHTFRSFLIIIMLRVRWSRFLLLSILYYRLCQLFLSLKTLQRRSRWYVREIIKHQVSLVILVSKRLLIHHLIRILITIQLKLWLCWVWHPIVSIPMRLLLAFYIPSFELNLFRNHPQLIFSSSNDPNWWLRLLF